MTPKNVLMQNFVFTVLFGHYLDPLNHWNHINNFWSRVGFARSNVRLTGHPSLAPILYFYFISTFFYLLCKSNYVLIALHAMYSNVSWTVHISLQCNLQTFQFSLFSTARASQSFRNTGLGSNQNHLPKISPLLTDHQVLIINIGNITNHCSWEFLCAFVDQILRDAIVINTSLRKQTQYWLIWTKYRILCPTNNLFTMLTL